MVVDNTPVEVFNIGGRDVLIKREDLAARPPLPPFSKVRGLERYLRRLKSEGVEVVGYVETAISMAGWAVSAIGACLGLKVVLFVPEYTRVSDHVRTLEAHRAQWLKFGPHEVFYPASKRPSIFWYSARKMMEELSGGQRWELLKLGIPLADTIKATAEEVKRTDLKGVNALVICIGSGTITAGVVRGLFERKLSIPVYGVTCREHSSTEAVKRQILKKAGLLDFHRTLLFKDFVELKVIDGGWGYTDYPRDVVITPNFPCNRYYDLKAWVWLLNNLEDLPDTVLFWNIGGGID